MVFSLRLPEEDRALLILLALAFLATRLPVLGYLPFVQDEGIYAIMIDEQAQHPTLVPTFLGHEVSWKPAPFFWAYAALSRLPLPLEIAYRFPSLLFGLLTIFPLYHLMRNATGAGPKTAFAATLAFLLSSVSIYPDTSLLTDTLSFLFICSSLYLYTEKKFDDKRFIAAGALAAAAFSIKLVVAGIVPVLAVAYFWFRGEKDVLSRPLFLASLLGVPLAAAVVFVSLQGGSMAHQLFFSDIIGHLIGAQSPSGPRDLPNIVASIAFASPGPWLLLSLIGVAKFWRTERFMALWWLILIFPMSASVFQPWYYLPVMPAIAYFAVRAVERRGITGAAIFAMCAMLALALLLFTDGLSYQQYMPQKEAGMLLAGKENALVIGNYAPGIAAYKMATEQRTLGRTLDFGWVLTPPGFRDLGEFSRDYWTAKYPVQDGSFGGMFTTGDIFRKETNITKFQYIAISSQGDYSVTGAEKLMDSPSIKVYRVGG